MTPTTGLALNKLEQTHSCHGGYELPSHFDSGSKEGRLKSHKTICWGILLSTQPQNRDAQARILLHCKRRKVDKKQSQMFPKVQSQRVLHLTMCGTASLRLLETQITTVISPTLPRVTADAIYKTMKSTFPGGELIPQQSLSDACQTNITFRIKP